jgi:hypothetical protein
LDSRKHKKNWK